MADSSSTGSTAPAVTLDPAGLQLAREALNAQNRQKAAEAELARREAELKIASFGLPTSFSATPPQGTVELGSGAGSLGELVAHGELDVLAKEISSAAVRSLADAERAAESDETVARAAVHAVRVLVVEDRALITSDWPHQHVRSQLKVIRDAVDVALKAAPSSPPTTASGIAPDAGEGAETVAESTTAAEASTSTGTSFPPLAMIGTAADLIGMFRTDYTLTTAPVAVPGAALATATAGALAENLYRGGGTGNAVVLDGFTVLEDSPILQDLARTIRRRHELALKVIDVQGQVGPTEADIKSKRDTLQRTVDARNKAIVDGKPDGVAPLDLRIDALTAEINQKAHSIAGTSEWIALATSTVQSVDTLAQLITSVPTGGGYPLIVSAAIRDRLHTSSRRRPEFTHVLHVSLDSSGGDVITQRNLFGSSGRVGFLGGVAGSWAMTVTASDAVIGAGTVSAVRRLTYDLAKDSTSSSRLAMDSDRPLPEQSRGLQTFLLIVVAVVSIVFVAAAVISIVTSMVSSLK